MTRIKNVGDIVKVNEKVKHYPAFTYQWCKVCEVKKGKKSQIGCLALFPLNEDPNTSNKYWFIFDGDLIWKEESKVKQLSIFDLE